MILRPWYDIKEVEELSIKEFVIREISTVIRIDTKESDPSTDEPQDEHAQD